MKLKESTNRRMSNKQTPVLSRNTSKTPRRLGQKRVRKSVNQGVGYKDEKRLKNILGQMIESLKTAKDAQGNVRVYDDIAAKLSKLAGLSNGHVWGWRYVASVHKETISPSKKFMRALDLLSLHISPRKKQWFYFSRRRSVAAVYDKSILRELILNQMHALGYKPVTFSRYTEIKKQRSH